MVAELNEKSDELDLIGFFALLWRRKILVLAVAVPIAFLAGVYALLAQSVYSAEAKVLFEPSFAVVSGPGTQSINALSRMESEVQIARSEDIILNVIKDLNLVSDARFDRRGRILDRLADQLGSATLSEADAIQSLERIRRQLENMVSVSQLNRSTLLSFNAQTPYPDLSASLSNSFASNYITSQINSKVTSAIESLRVVREAVDDAGANLEASQKSLSQYLLDNAQEISFRSGNVDIALLADDLDVAQAAVNQAITGRERLQDVLVRGNFEALENVFAVSSGDDLLVELQAQIYFELESQRREIVERLQSQGSTDELQDRLNGIEAEISSLANERLDQLVEEAAIQQEKQASIRGQLEVEVFSADLPPEIASDLFKLQSDASSSREQYVTLVDRADDLAVQSRTQLADSRVVARATVPLRPSGPNRTGILAIGLIVGLALAVGAAVIVEVLFGGIYSGKHLEEKLGIRRYAVVPRLKFAKTLADTLIDDPFGTFAESLRMLRSEISKSSGITVGLGDMEHNGQLPKVISVTSSVPSEGKTTTSVGLAVVTAMAGQKTCLVDFDFRKPSVSEYTGLEVNHDLASYFQGQADGFSIQTLDYDFGSGHLDIVTGAVGGRINADQALSSGKLKLLVDDLKRAYDMVIIDTAPILAAAETQFIAQFSDGAVYCIRENHAPLGVINQSFEKLQSALVKRSGITVALTISNSRTNRYYYAYKSYAGN